jgi:leader peptidase (prepilin peptidase)/N-methyltransferase
MPLESWFFFIMLALLGAAFGSFANVVIWRFPRGESLSTPPSHCPRCGHPVRGFDNIPVVSWLVLGGKCRDCHEPISPRYPAVEALSALLWVAAGARFGMTPATAWAIALFYLLMILSFIDLDIRRLPNALVAILAVAGGVGVVVAQLLGVTACPLVGTGLPGWLASPAVSATAGAALGAGIALAISLVYQAVRKRQGMGMGDVKLLGALGLFLGPFVLLAFFAATVVGAVVGVVGLIASRRGAPSAGDTQGGSQPEVQADADPVDTRPASDRPDPSTDGDLDVPGPPSLPFGPFLAFGAVLTVLWGPQIVAAYLGLVGFGPS